MPNKLREILNLILDEMIGDPEDIIGQGGYVDYDDFEWEDDDCEDEFDD